LAIGPAATADIGSRRLFQHRRHLMDVLNIGPIALPVTVFIPVVAMAVSVAAAIWLRKRRGVDVEPVLWKVMLGGLLTARVAFVAAHFDLYASAPWSVLRIGDSGFSAIAGLLGALVTGVLATSGKAALRTPLMTTLAAGAVAWGATTIATTDFKHAAMPVPQLVLQRLDGSPLALGSLAGKPLVINLWATWCPPCRREMPALRDAQLRNPGVVFVFADQGEDAQTVRDYLAREGLAPDNVVLDPVRQVAGAAKASATPTTLFFDSRGRLVSRRVGELSAATLADRLAQLEVAPPRR
jgi:thiol-disulfide isomerase/thioredoxin